MENRLLTQYTHFVEEINKWSEKDCNRYLNDFSQHGTAKTVLVSTLIRIRKNQPPFQGIIYTQLFEKIFKPMRENKSISNLTLNQDWF
jgi:hypothetical protein